MTEGDEKQDAEDEQRDSFEQQEGGEQSVVRILRPVTFGTEAGKTIDERTVSPLFYNCFNYSLLSRDQKDFNLTIGITSANPREGKTLVASNLAVSLAISTHRETILVDLNIRSPRIHSVFGTKLTPGLVESLGGESIQVVPTKIKYLYVLPAGSPVGNPQVAGRMTPTNTADQTSPRNPFLGLEHLAAFRDVIYSLRQTFEFVIIDMPATHEPRIPIQLTHQMDGLIVVVDANRTKHADIERTFGRLDKNRILGFVMNRASDGHRY